MGENSQKFENWATLTPRSSTTIRLTENLTDLGNSLAVGLQRVVNSISLQCITWPVACSEWGACLTDFRFQIFLGKMTPNLKSFENVFLVSATEHRTTFCDHIWWKSAIAKLPIRPLDYHTKKLGLHGTRPSPHFVQNGPIAPKIPWTLSPLDKSIYTEFGLDRLHLAGLITKRLIFRPQK